MIIKRKVQACTDISSIDVMESKTTLQEDAKNHVKEAIDCLCKVGKDNVDIQQAIANLSVIFFDLENIN